MPFDMNASFAGALRSFACVAALLIVPALSVQAQARKEQLETRSGLIERAAAAERAGRKGEAAAIRARLSEGDFQEGDRIIIELENNPNAGRGDASTLIRPDTLSVRSGRVLIFPQARFEGVGDLKIGGLLRSEIADTVRAHFARIYRNPQMRVTPLIALSVTGAVVRPGAIDVQPDLRLSDVFIYAGGWAADANMEKVKIMRGGQELMDGKQVRQALDNGLTVDNAQLRAGDQIIVARRNPNAGWLTYAGTALSLITLAVAISRGR
jgi:hypothetical protein